MLHCKRSCKRNLQSGWAGPISWLLSLCCHSNSSLHVKSCLPSALQEEWPLLIIVPASLRLVWAEEIERWLPHIRPGDVTVIEGKDDRSASTATTASLLGISHALLLLPPLRLALLQAWTIAGLSVWGCQPASPSYRAMVGA